MAGLGEGRPRSLNPGELALLTDTWRVWAESAPTPARSVQRARMHLFFLLVRFGGLRPSEIFPLDTAGLCDLSAGTLQACGRRLFLPAEAARSLRRILTLPESSRPDFLRPDAGFTRRTFYAVSELAGLPPASCAPRALRFARALEMLAMNMAPHLVAKALGFKSPLQIARLMENGHGAPAAPNSFDALVTRIEPGARSALLSLELRGGLPLYCVCGLDELTAAEPEAGRVIRVHIPPESVTPALESESGPNRLPCAVMSVLADQFEIFLRLKAGRGLEFRAVLDRLAAGPAVFAKEQKITVKIPAHAVKLSS